ncbi:MAG: hypothetical protein ACXW1R_08460 [Halobacteriota archaeon]
MTVVDPPIAAAYLSGFDYNATHFIRALNDGGFLDTLFTWLTFAGNGIFIVWIAIALYLAGARTEALVITLVFFTTTTIAFRLKYAIARPRRTI